MAAAGIALRTGILTNKATVQPGAGKAGEAMADNDAASAPRKIALADKRGTGEINPLSETKSPLSLNLLRIGLRAGNLHNCILFL